LLGEEADGQERLVQFVGDTGPELAHGHHLPGLEEFVAGLLQLPVDFLHLVGIVLGLVLGLGDLVDAPTDSAGHLVEGPRQAADLVGRRDIDAPGEIAGREALGGPDQLLDRAADRPRHPEAEENGHGDARQHQEDHHRGDAPLGLLDAGDVEGHRNDGPGFLVYLEVLGGGQVAGPAQLEDGRLARPGGPAEGGGPDVFTAGEALPVAQGRGDDLAVGGAYHQLGPGRLAEALDEGVVDALPEKDRPVHAAGNLGRLVGGDGAENHVPGGGDDVLVAHPPEPVPDDLQLPEFRPEKAPVVKTEERIPVAVENDDDVDPGAGLHRDDETADSRDVALVDGFLDGVRVHLQLGEEEKLLEILSDDFRGHSGDRADLGPGRLVHDPGIPLDAVGEGQRHTDDDGHRKGEEDPIEDPAPEPRPQPHDDAYHRGAA
jgi:hypothetical protein